jgi:hydrogenase maturation protease
MIYPRKTLLVGIGSPHGDDRAGWEVVDRLASRAPEGVVIRQAQVPMDLLGWLDDFERLVVCDAAHHLGPPGHTCRWKWPADEIEATAWSGTHHLSLAATLALADRLGRSPPDVIVWAIAGESGEPGTQLSAEVSLKIPIWARQVARDLAPVTPNRTAPCTSIPW